MKPRRIYLAQPMAHQLDVLRDPSRNKVLACGRRWGKTKLGEIACVEGHGPRQGGHRGAVDGGNIWWIAPTYPVSSMIWRSLKHSLRDGWMEKNENERRIVLPGGGSITVKSADNPDSLRGDGLDGAVLDEAAFMVPEAWAACIRPALSDRRGWAMFLTTPNGLNWFHEVFQDVPNRAGWARWQRPTADNPIIDATEIESARRDVGSFLFAQEYEAQFLTAGGGLFKAPWFEHRFDWLNENHVQLEGGQVVHRDRLLRYATADLATSTRTTADYTVVAVVGRVPGDAKLVLLDLVRARLEGPDIVPTLKAVTDRWSLSSVWVEKVAFQLAIVQAAARAGIPVREAIPDRDKVARALPLTAALESGQFLFPRSASWLDPVFSELLAFPNAGPQGHDDIVDALSYAVAVRDQIGRGSLWSSAPRADPDDDEDEPRPRRRPWAEITGSGPRRPWSEISGGFLAEGAFPSSLFARGHGLS